MGFGELVKWVQRELEEMGQQPARGPFQNDPQFIDSPRAQPPSQLRGSPTIRMNPASPILVEGVIDPIPPLPDSAAFQEWGIDVLAYYLPFHFHRRRWGIYVRSHGIAYLASLLKKGPLSAADAPVVQLARDILFEHESFHFFTEVAATRCEFTARHKLYRPYYTQLPAWHLEEALANAHAFRRTIRRDAAAFRGAVFGFMKSSPLGYRDFDNFLKSSKFLAGQRDAAAFVMAPITAATSPSPWPTEFLFRGIARSLVPTHLVMDLSLPWLRLGKAYPKHNGIRVWVHTNDHQPPHFHVESPPGNERARYVWPEMQPLTGDARLSANEEKALGEYVRKFGTGIRKKLESVYGKLPEANL